MQIIVSYARMSIANPVLMILCGGAIGIMSVLFSMFRNNSLCCR